MLQRLVLFMAKSLKLCEVTGGERAQSEPWPGSTALNITQHHPTLHFGTCTNILSLTTGFSLSLWLTPHPAPFLFPSYFSYGVPSQSPVAMFKTLGQNSTGPSLDKYLWGAFTCYHRGVIEMVYFQGEEKQTTSKEFKYGSCKFNPPPAPHPQTGFCRDYH